MTPTDIALVQASFRKIMPIADQAAALFYARLFELDPTLRSMFPGDIQDQGGKLMSMLATAVSSLASIETLVPTLTEHGSVPASCRMIQGHAAAVGTALLWTLQKGLGPEFTPAVRAAWTTAYALVATALNAAGRCAPVPA